MSDKAWEFLIAALVLVGPTIMFRHKLGCYGLIAISIFVGGVSLFFVDIDVPIRIILALPYVFGIWLSEMSGRFIINTWLSQRWPTTQAQIQKSVYKEAIAQTRTGEISTYHPKIQYFYTVENETFIGNWLTYANKFAPTFRYEWEAKEFIEKYPIDSWVTIHYHPQYPHRAMLFTQLRWRSVVAFIFGLLILLVSAWYALNSPTYPLIRL